MYAEAGSALGSSPFMSKAFRKRYSIRSLIIVDGESQVDKICNLPMFD